MQEFSPDGKSIRFNARAAALLLVVTSMTAIGLVAFYFVHQRSRLRDGAMATAGRLAREGRVGLAVRNLDELLRLQPDAMDALELKARLLARSARTVEELLGAGFVNDQLIRADPNGPGVQEARRRAADLFIRYSDLYLESSYYRVAPEVGALNLRYRVAAILAEQLIGGGATDAGAHRLLARAKEGQAQNGDDRTLGDAIEHYRLALRLEPGDVETAERLAGLLNDRRRDQAAAIRVLDELARRRPDSPEVRLARHRFLARLGLDVKALEELDRALELAPDDPTVCLAAAEAALRRGRTDEARRFADKLRGKDRDDLRARLVLGLIDLNEDRPEEAMGAWRKGLVSSRGSDAMLTWNLAYSLLQLKRLDEARPLVAQYQRLINDGASPMLNLLLAIEDQKMGRSFNAAARLEGIRERIDRRWRPMLEATLGQCYAEVGDQVRAAAAYRRVLQENPRANSARLALAENLTKARPREAANLMEEGLKLSPDDPAMWVALASARLSEQEKLPPVARSWEAFDRAMARAVELAPRHPSITAIRSLRQSLDGKTADATALLEGAIRREPGKLKLWETLSETLLKAGRPAEALEVLERASSPDAVGDQIGIRLARARVLAGLGRAREARELLSRDVDKLVPDQRVMVWDALGRELTARGDLPEARDAYVEWARRMPEDARPRLALLEQSLTGGEADARAASEALRGLGVRDDVVGRLSGARDLIRAGGDGTRGKEGGDAGFREAEQILDAVRVQSSQVAALDILQGELFERRDRRADAIAAYRRAWGKGVEGVLPRLVDLMARNRPGDLEQLAGTDVSSKVVRLAARACLLVGQPECAARIAAKESANSESPETLAWRVELLERLGKLERVMNLLKDETTRHPELAEPWLALVRALARHRRAEAISSTLDDARKAIKDDRSDFVEARLGQAAGDRPGADRAFAASLARRPDDVEILRAAADHYQEGGKPAEAESCLRRILALKGDHRAASRKLALLLASGPLDEAGWQRAWAALGPESPGETDPEDRLARAILLANGPGPDRRRRSVASLEALVADLPHETRAAAGARDLLARLLLDSGQAGRAARLLGPWAEQGDNIDEIALYGSALLQAGRLDSAGLQLDRLAKLAPGDDREGKLRARLISARARPGEAPRALERAFLDLGQSPRAGSFGREAFTLLLAASPPAGEIADRVGRRLASWDPAASWMPAMIAGRRRRPAEALRLCRLAVETAGPADAREAGRVAFGAAFADPGVDHLGELEEILEAANRRDPGGTEIPLQLAQLRHHQGRYEDVVRLYRQVIDRRPDLRPSIQNNIAWVLSEDLHRPLEGIPLVDDLLKTQGRTAAILDTRGVILTRLGRLDEATKDLEESIRLDPNPLHLFHLARAYRNAGQTKEFERTRDLIRRAGLAPNAVSPSERAELASLMQP